MLNPKWFKRFALPDIITQIEHMDYAIYHMDGPNQIKYLEDLLSIPQLTGIQWVPGQGRQPQGAEEWFPLYKKIQKYGKNIIIDTSAEFVPHLYRKLDSKGLFVRTLYRSERFANIYLPNFIGGKEGGLVLDTVKWLKEQGKQNITKLELIEYLNSLNLTIDNKLRNDLLKEINGAMKEKLYFG